MFETVDKFLYPLLPVVAVLFCLWAATAIVGVRAEVDRLSSAFFAFWGGYSDGLGRKAEADERELERAFQRDERLHERYEREADLAEKRYEALCERLEKIERALVGFEGGSR